MRVLRWATFVPLLACGVAAAQAPDPSSPTFRTGIDVVIVEATVVDRSGAVVPGLTGADFEVEIGGNAREVVSAELVEHQAGAIVDAGRRGTTAPVSPGPDVSINTEAITSRTVLIVADLGSLGPDNRTFIDAARRWLRTLGATDRVGLVGLPPPGPMVEFTTNHELVDEALSQAVLAGGVPPAAFSTKNVGLWEAIRINAHDTMTRNLVLERECRIDDVLCPFEIDAAARDIAADALSRTRPFVGSLRNILLALRVLPGPKHAVLLSGGWPVDPQSMGSTLEPVAAAAATANVILHALVTERSATEPFMRRVSPSSVQDRNMMMASIEALAGWTGGQSARVIGLGDGAFNQLTEALAGYYRLGVRPAPEDLDGKVRRISVKVSRPGLSIRSHRQVFAATAETADPGAADPSAELRAAILSGAPRTGLAVRATSYVLHEEENDRDRMRLLVAGDISGGAAGAATVGVALFDGNGRLVSGGDRDIRLAEDQPARISATLSAPPGAYSLRIAARDEQGRVGSLQRDVHLKWREAGGVGTTDLALFHVGAAAGATPSPVIDTVSPNEQLIAQLAISTPEAAAAEPSPSIEITPDAGAEPVVRQPLRVGRLAGSRWLAQETFPLNLLPPGRYLVTAVIAPGVPPLRRTIEVVAAEAPPAESAAAGASAAPPAGGSPPPAAPPARAARLALVSLARPAPFERAVVLDPAHLAPILARLAERVNDPSAREALERMNTGPWPTDAAQGALASAPVAGHFVAGLGRLQAGELEAAATEFRSAVQAAPDFAPALAYLAACFAEGGKDTEAAAAWQTALVRERESPWLQRLAIEAWLRAERPVPALSLIRQARQRFPDDESFVRLQARAELADGRAREGLETMASVGRPDAPLLLMALASVYTAAKDGTPIWDTARDLEAMKRWREAYLAAGGDSVALVDAWLAEVSSIPPERP